MTVPDDRLAAIHDRVVGQRHLAAGRFPDGDGKQRGGGDEQGGESKASGGHGRPPGDRRHAGLFRSGIVLSDAAD